MRILAYNSFIGVTMHENAQHRQISVLYDRKNKGQVLPFALKGKTQDPIYS